MTNELVPIAEATIEQELQLPPVDYIQQQIAEITTFQNALHQLLREGLDYGIIKGTKSPTLYKAGAEKVAKLLSVEPQYEIDKVEDWNAEPPFFDYTVTCTLYKIGSGVRIGMGVGSCNTAETKYRYRWESGIRIIDAETPSKKNTCLKMAKKRSLVDAVLGFATLSEIFTQDLEDMDVIDVQPRRAQRQSRQRPPAPSPYEQLTIFVQQQGKTMDDVAQLIGAPATDANIRAFVAEKNTGDFSAWLLRQWQGQGGGPPPEAVEQPAMDVGLNTQAQGEH